MTVAVKNTRQVVVLATTRRVVRYKGDAVGNDLTAVLRWCEKHAEAVWEYGDGSFSCPLDLITEVRSDDHDIVDGPWEVQG